MQLSYVGTKYLNGRMRSMRAAKSYQPSSGGKLVGGVFAPACTKLSGRVANFGRCPLIGNRTSVRSREKHTDQIYTAKTSREKKRWFDNVLVSVGVVVCVCVCERGVWGMGVWRCVRVRSGVGTCDAGVARRRVHLAKVLRLPSGHHSGRR